jgi:hypothetical protein
MKKTKTPSQKLRLSETHQGKVRVGETSCASIAVPKNIVTEAIIVSELELRNVKMQVFLADIVECADDTALDDAPKALNRVGINSADHVLMPRVVNGGRIASVKSGYIAFQSRSATALR